MRLLFVTGTRADFGKLSPVIAEFIGRGYEVKIFATGMHLFDEFGLTINEVKRKFGNFVYEYKNQNLEDPHTEVFLKTQHGLQKLHALYEPNLVFVHGDRVEAFAACAYFAMNQTPIAHIEGGEVSGTIDEVYRHCNTKLSNIHFVSSRDAARRVRSMGEHPDHIFCTGSPELDLHSSDTRPSLSTVKERYEIKFSSYGILVFHPVVSETESIQCQAELLVQQLILTSKNFVVIKPNNDPGFNKIISAYSQLPECKFKIIPSMRFEHFSRLLQNARLVVGNSSLGIREAPFFGIPSIDIGTRQTNRSISRSVINLHRTHLIRLNEMVQSLWGKSFAPSTAFGDGEASKRIVDTVSSDILKRISVQKFYEDFKDE
tara:strand:- start:1517 stop:2638 length:1122 start_codon:yes stop_codon:yes gene_type:complete